MGEYLKITDVQALTDDLQQFFKDHHADVFPDQNYPDIRVASKRKTADGRHQHLLVNIVSQINRRKLYKTMAMRQICSTYNTPSVGS